MVQLSREERHLLSPLSPKHRFLSCVESWNNHPTHWLLGKNKTLYHTNLFLPPVLLSTVNGTAPALGGSPTTPLPTCLSQLQLNATCASCLSKIMRQLGWGESSMNKQPYKSQVWFQVQETPILGWGGRHTPGACWSASYLKGRRRVTACGCVHRVMDPLSHHQWP